MIFDPANDGACLGQLTKMARELYRTTLVQTIARRLKSPTGVIEWLRSLPQSDDDGTERLQYIACDVDQRTRLFPSDPNCFERSFAALALLEVLEPKTARMLVSIDKPLRHTGIVEARGGRWVPIDLFPRRNADGAKIGGDILKGIHTYVGKPLLTFFLGQDTGGKLADTVGALEDKLVASGTKPAARPARPTPPRPAPPSASGARITPTAKAWEVKPTQGGTNAQEESTRTREYRVPQARRPRPGDGDRAAPWSRRVEAQEDHDHDDFDGGAYDDA